MAPILSGLPRPRSRLCLTVLMLIGLWTLLASTAFAATYRVQPGDTLYLIGQRHGVTAESIRQANGLQGETVYPGQVLTIPSGGGRVYIAQPGDTLYLVGQRYGVTVASLRQVNSLQSDTLRPGQVLTIPSGDGWLYTVQSGDTMYVIANRYGTTVAALQTANGVGNSIQVGQQLWIPTGAQSNPAGPAGNPGAPGLYTVQPGDSLYLIAERFGTTYQDLMRVNSLKSPDIKVGQVLRIPSAADNSASRSAPPRSSGSVADLDMLAHLIYGEARGETYSGQVAVAAVVLNRVGSPKFPNTVAGVVFQPGAFTAVNDGQYYLAPDQAARNAARDALNGWDPTGGALYYWNPSTATSSWVWSRTVTTQIGNHVFAL